MTHSIPNPLLINPFNLDLAGRSPSDLKQLSQTRPPPLPLAVENPHRQKFEVEYQDFGSVFDLVDSLDGKAPPLSSLSRLAWVGCGEGTYVLELFKKGHIKIQLVNNCELSSFHPGPINKKKLTFLHPTPAIYEAKYYPRTSSAPHSLPNFSARPISLGSHPSLGPLLNVADAFVSTSPRLSSLNISLLRTAPWRRSPSTPIQVAFVLSKLAPPNEETRFEQLTTIEGVWVGRPWRERVEVGELDRGLMTDLISRIKHGGVGFWKKNRRRLEKGEGRGDE